MKIAMVIACDLFTGKSYGGKQCALRNLELLRAAAAPDELKTFAFSVNIPRQPPAGMTVYPALGGNLQVALGALARYKVMSPATERKVLAALRDFEPDLLWVDNSQLGRLFNRSWNVPTVCFFQNAEQLYAKHKVEYESKIYLPSYWSSTYNETCAVRRADRLVCLNARDSAELKSLYGRGADLLLPISFGDVFDPVRATQTQAAPRTLLFVGSKFPPNVDGITWFVNRVMPQLPEYTLKIVGRSFETLKDTLTRSNVQVIGGVEDLAAYYYESSAMVMPIQYGDGMKVKTAEAMMYGKSIFATTEALEGYEVTNLDGVWRCDDATAFVQAIRLAEETGELLPYRKAVRRRFLEKYDTATVQAEFDAFLRGVQAGQTADGEGKA